MTEQLSPQPENKPSRLIMMAHYLLNKFPRFLVPVALALSACGDSQSTGPFTPDSIPTPAPQSTPDISSSRPTTETFIPPPARVPTPPSSTN